MNQLFVKLCKSGIYLPICVVLFVFAESIKAQNIVDKTVATVSDGVRTELITYSDLIWQLALVPDIPINPPSSQNLNLSLQLIIQQRLIALEAKRLPRGEPTNSEIEAEIKRILALFPTSASLVVRLNLVGFKSVEDENFQRMIEERVATDKYVDFRFRSFVVITSEDENIYYRDEFTEDFKRRNSGRPPPPLDQVRDDINKILTERKVEQDIEAFLDNARDRAEIIILSEV